MNRARRTQCGCIALVILFGLMPATGAEGRAAGSAPPSGGAEGGGPRSRLMVAGLYEADYARQEYFFLGARAADPGMEGLIGDEEAYWTQRLNLKPRFIVSDDMNLNISVDLAHGVWGLNDVGGGGDAGYLGRYYGSGGFFDLRLDWAYLAYRSNATGTRWYIGRQQFALGNRIVLDMDAPGIQVYRDFGLWNSSLGFGFAKQSGMTQWMPEDPEMPAGGQGTAANLLYAEWLGRSGGGGFLFNPFFVRYTDEGEEGEPTFLPHGQGYSDARFRPSISEATVFGFQTLLNRGVLHANLEFNLLSGKDHISRGNSGADELLDLNNGDLSGMNAFVDLSLQYPRLELGGTIGLGSGDPDPFRTEGNFNSLRTQGHFSVTEVWADGLAMDERGLAPGGLGNPFTRGYRGLENTRIMQGRVGFLIRPGMRLSASYSIIRATEELKPWHDADGDGVITPDEYGRDADRRAGVSTDLGNEINARLDWVLERNLTLSIRYGLFMPGEAAGFLINGTSKYLENAYELRAGVSVPIPEFSLGG